jgi:hypothetical protein
MKGWEHFRRVENHAFVHPAVVDFPTRLEIGNGIPKGGEVRRFLLGFMAGVVIEPIVKHPSVPATLERQNLVALVPRLVTL